MHGLRETGVSELRPTMRHGSQQDILDALKNLPIHTTYRVLGSGRAHGSGVAPGGASPAFAPWQEWMAQVKGLALERTRRGLSRVGMLCGW